MYWFTFSFSKSEPLSIKCVHPVWLFIENYWISGCLRLLKMDHYGSVLLECGALIDSSFAFKVHAEIQQELPEWMTFRAGAGHFSCSPEGEAQSIHPISKSPSQDKHTPSIVALTPRGDLESQSDPNMKVLGFIHWENMQALHRKTLSPDRSLEFSLILLGWSTVTCGMWNELFLQPGFMVKYLFMISIQPQLHFWVYCWLVKIRRSQTKVSSAANIIHPPNLTDAGRIFVTALPCWHRHLALKPLCALCCDICINAI